MKAKYLTPAVELVILDEDDVIATSGDTPWLNPFEYIQQKTSSQGYDW